MLKIAISPCPNDTFNFYALLTKKITFNFPYDIKMMPLHELNQAYGEGSYDFIKVSSVPYLKSPSSYRVCKLGGAFASEKGPVILARKPFKKEDLPGLTFAVAGKDTTAGVLLQTLFKSPRTVAKPFFDIISSIQNEEVDAGVVIHEGRTKAKSHALYELCDLTKLWFEAHNVPSPLALLLGKKSLEQDVFDGFEVSLNESINYAKANKEEAFKFCAEFSQEKDLDSIRQHVGNFALNQELFSDQTKKKALSFFNDQRKLYA